MWGQYVQFWIVCVCVWVHVIGWAGAAVGDTPPTPPLLCIKQMGGEESWSLCSQTQGQSHSLDTQTLWTDKLFRDTSIWEKEHISVFSRLDSPGGGSETEKRERQSLTAEHHRHAQDSPFSSFRSKLLFSHEDLQPALPAPVGDSCCGTTLLCQTR